MGTESKDLRMDDKLETKVNNYVLKKRRSSPWPLSVFSKTFLVVLLIYASILTALGLFVQQPVVLILAGIETFVASLHEQGTLRPDLSFEEAVDALWALTSYDLYRVLVVERGWEPARYVTWLAQILIQQMLQPVDE